MGIQKQHGFTIIEVMLFVAISAVVTTAALIGWSTNINTQSYRDSARSLASVLGQQYTNTLNVSNDRSSEVNCTAAGVVDTSKTPIGQSDCVLMGRYIVLDGTKLTMSNIIGYGNSTSSSDIDAIEAYSPKTDPDTSSYSLPWSSRPYPSGAQKANTLHAVIVIVRSPVSGTAYTFIETTDDSEDRPTVNSVIDSSSSQRRFVVCLDPEATVTGGSLAVVIDKYAASSSAVSVSSGESSCGNI